MLYFKMKAFVIFSIFSLILSVNCENSEVKDSKGGTAYTTKYDNLDLDEILKSDRLLLNYVNCLLDKSHCSPDADELKSKIYKFVHMKTTSFVQIKSFCLNLQKICPKLSTMIVRNVVRSKELALEMLYIFWSITNQNGGMSSKKGKLL